MDAVPPWIPFPHSETIQVGGDVICSPRVREPSGVAKDGRRRSSSKACHLGVGRLERVVVALATLPSKMPGAAAEMALNALVTTTSVVTAVTTTVATIVVLLAVASAATVAAVTTTGIVVVAAVVAVVVAALAAVVALAPIGVVVGVAVGVPSDVVDGGAAMLKMKTSSVVFAAPVEGDRVGVELTKRHALGTSGVRGDEGLVVVVEARDDVLVAHGVADSCKLIGVGADLGKVVRHGKGSFPENRHVHLDLDDTGAAMDGLDWYELYVCFNM